MLNFCQVNFVAVKGSVSNKYQNLVIVQFEIALKIQLLVRGPRHFVSRLYFNFPNVFPNLIKIRFQQRSFGIIKSVFSEKFESGLK